VRKTSIASPGPSARRVKFYVRTAEGGTKIQFPRAWGRDTIYVDRGKGGHVTRISGRGTGSSICAWVMGRCLGHADPHVDDAVAEAARQGVSFSR